ncbi:MAG: hypothetical protein IAE77_16925 [Prosthecobacter sp.]|jgi:hypothetical protein|uniref:hypothetical protein n=1 Tax=Prosthecobacter sp. TaxID=1965333 RepID=UPI001A0B9C84|nr:hypothetical protein [Prosthecobacter sp.]MBE2285146.1 hypothetical protein [Prosthecobacter sp.]
MAASITPSLRSALERLKHAGSVNGLLLCWRRQILINLLPFEEFRAERLLQVIHDARAHFASGGDRDVTTFWFGYEGVFILALFHGECLLVTLHTHASEVDFLRRAGLTFLDDTQLLVQTLLQPSPDDEISREETQPLGQVGSDGLPPEGSGPTKVIPRKA